MTEPRAYIETFSGIEMHSTVKGHDKHLRVLTFDYGVDIALRDGVATAKRRHRALVLTFCADVETPMLLDALTKNSDIAELTIKFYRHVGAKWSTYATFTFSHARVESMSLRYAEDDGLETMHVTASMVYRMLEIAVANKKYADLVFDQSSRQ